MAAEPNGDAPAPAKPHRPHFDETQLRRYLRYAMIPSLGVSELCVIGGKYHSNKIVSSPYKATMAGWYDDPEAFVRDAARLWGVTGYICQNPADRALLGRKNNRIEKVDHRTEDKNIATLCWWYIDVDTKAPPDVSSTDAECAAAAATQGRILAENPNIARSAIWGRSGNGRWIEVRLPNLPNTPENKAKVAAAMASLAARYSTEDAKIDPAVKNAARLGPLPGTLKCKGNPIEERPWRLATIEGAAGAPLPENPADDPELPFFDIDAWLEAHPAPAPAPKVVKAAQPVAVGGIPPTPAPTQSARPDKDVILYRASCYAGAIDGAVSTQGGHNKTFDVACAMIKGYDLSVDEARPILQAYNLKCSPPWSEQELEHKLRSADEKPDDKPRGYLIDAPWEGRAEPTPPQAPAPEPVKPPSVVDAAWLAGEFDALVATGKLELVYRAAGLHRDLAILERENKAEAEIIKANLAKLAGFRVRTFEALLKPHRDQLRTEPPPGKPGGGRPDGGGRGDDGGTSPNHTDMGNARRFLDHFGHVVRFCPVFGAWFIYDGRRWAQDRGRKIEEMAQKVPELIRAEMDGKGEEACEAIEEWAIKTEGKDRLFAIPALAAPLVSIAPSAFDADPWALNCLNGTIDLRTGLLRPHRAEDFIRSLCPVAYDPDAQCPEFDAFVLRIMSAQAVLVSYLRRVFGYAATGVIREHVFFVCYGKGGNGKGTLFSTIRHVLGDFAIEIDAQLLVAQNNPQHPTGLTELEGRRLVEAEEPKERVKLDEALVKKLTGGNEIQARKMRQDFYYFKPSHKLFMVANDKPDVSASDEGMWRRLRLIPFLAKFRDNAEDPAAEKTDVEMVNRLIPEAPGILAWLVRGCMEWQRDGLSEPPEILDATQAYRSEQDILGNFLEERTVAGERERVAFDSLYEEYRAWSERSGHKPMSKRTLGLRLNDKSFPSLKSNSVTYRTGLRLRNGPPGFEESAEPDRGDTWLPPEMEGEPGSQSGPWAA